MHRIKLFFFCSFVFLICCLPNNLFGQANITQIKGGVISAQYSDSPSGEGINNLIDNSVNTKYLTFHASGWMMFKANQAYVIKKYALSSANDSPERDPKSWVLEASNDGSNWKTLDTKTNESFAARFQRNEYPLTSNSTAYIYYRITINNVSGSILQLSEWELWIDPVAHDVGIGGISVPVPHPLAAVTPKITVRNDGSNTESFPVTCSISLSGAEIYKQTVDVSSLAVSDSKVVSFPDWTPTVDKIYVVKAWTSLPGDMMVYNDTLSVITNSQKKMYMVGYAHLDLQWNWDLGTTVSQYIPNTMEHNFPYFEKYPFYKFTFEGAYRYMIMKKRFPADYAKVKTYVASGQWNVGGAMVEACDVNMPSAESLFRQILYGQNFFNEEFGKTCEDILLPDCFGFPYTLPTIAHHSGLKGFSTQKFDLWGGFKATPFSIGRWQGVDGSQIVAVLKPGAYDNGPEIRANDVNQLGAATGLYLGYDYYGIGDMGGAPTEDKLISLQNMINNNTTDITPVPASSDQIFRDLSDDLVSRLNVYDGELLMTRHGTGCYTAQALMKLYNRQNELMATSAERASVMADLFTGVTYPRETIKTDWINFLCHQFHDDITGTSVSSAYNNYSYPDEKNSLASFTKVRDDANTAIAAKLNTAVDDAANSVPVVVYNPIATNRNDISQASVTFSNGAPKYIKVYDANGNEVPSQIKSVSGQTATILFMANVPGSGYAVFQVKKTDAPCTMATGLSVTTSSLENKRYKVEIDEFGDISSIYDKKVGKELLLNSAGFEVKTDKSQEWPAWEVLYSDVTSVPRSYVIASVQKTIADTGAAQISVKITRSNEGSSYTHYYVLTADTIGYLRVNNTVDWKPTDPNGSLLKVTFPLTATNPVTTYDLGIGTIGRGVNTESLYEVPGHQWADITNTDNSYGVSVLNDCKYGWDKPANNVINLTLIHTPNGTSFNYKGDIFVHTFAFGVYGHTGSWADGNVVNVAERFNQPLVAFQTTAHADGGLGKTFSFVSSNPAQLAVMAVKKAEYGDEYVIRVREAAGKNWSNATLNFPNTVVEAKEVNGMEQSKGSVNFTEKSISFDLKPYEPKTFSIQFKNALTGVKDSKTLLPLYNLEQNYPNPFNPSTVINYSLPIKGLVSLKVYDILGKNIGTLVNETQNAGKHSVQFNAQKLSSGVYFYTLKSGDFCYTRKMLLVK